MRVGDSRLIPMWNRDIFFGLQDGETFVGSYLRNSQPPLCISLTSWPLLATFLVSFLLVNILFILFFSSLFPSISLSLSMQLLRFFFSFFLPSYFLTYSLIFFLHFLHSIFLSSFISFFLSIMIFFNNHYESRRFEPVQIFTNYTGVFIWKLLIHSFTCRENIIKVKQSIKWFSLNIISCSCN
jgi:hypothetical protein